MYPAVQLLSEQQYCVICRVSTLKADTRREVRVGFPCRHLLLHFKRWRRSEFMLFFESHRFLKVGWVVSYVSQVLKYSREECEAAPLFPFPPSVAKNIARETSSLLAVIYGEHPSVRSLYRVTKTRPTWGCLPPQARGVTLCRDSAITWSVWNMTATYSLSTRLWRARPGSPVTADRARAEICSDTAVLADYRQFEQMNSSANCLSSIVTLLVNIYI